MKIFRVEDFFDLKKCGFRDLYEGVEQVWEAIGRIKPYIEKRLKELGPGCHGKMIGKPWIGEDGYIGEGTVVEEGAMIKGPTVIGRNCEIRHGAYIRGFALIDDRVVIGNSTEVKNAAIHQEALLPHFNYAGDSIIGWRVHLGGGCGLANLKLNWEMVKVKSNEEKIATGLKKFGAIIGDYCDMGGDTILNPGTLVGPRSIIYANTVFGGYLAPESIVKARVLHEIVKRDMGKGLPR